MRLPIFLVLVALCHTAYAQTKLDFTALEGVFAKFPNCSVSGSFSEEFNDH